MTNRFEELQKKGWVNLDASEREEYKALKPTNSTDSGANSEVKTTLSAVAKEDATEKTQENDRIARLEKMVELLASENSNLREESAKLQEGWADYKPPTDQNKTATLKVWRKDSDSPAGVVVKLTTFKNNAFNEETRKNDKLIYNVTVCYDDGSTEEMKLDASDFVGIREIEKVEVVKEDRRTLRKVEDYVTVPNKDKQGYPMRMLDGGTGLGQNIGSGKAPLEVFMVKSTVVVKRRSGQEITMEADYLNL